MGINIVANFISPAFDFSNLAPQYISWRGGGMITAVGSVLLTPWNWEGGGLINDSRRTVPLLWASAANGE